MRVLAWILIAFFISEASIAQACSYRRPPNEAATRHQVRQAIENSDVLVEGIVERDGRTDGISVLRATRIWRGPRETHFRIFVPTSCHMRFSAGDVGRRVRVALWFGAAAQLYAMPIIRQPRLYQRLLDRELRRMTPYTP